MGLVVEESNHSPTETVQQSLIYYMSCSVFIEFDTTTYGVSRNPPGLYSLS